MSLSCKDLLAMVEELRGQNSALEARITALESRPVQTAPKPVQKKSSPVPGTWTVEKLEKGQPVITIETDLTYNKAKAHCIANPSLRMKRA